MYKVGEYVVCPGHGVAQVSEIESRQLGDSDQSFYILKIVNNGMTVMLPTIGKDGSIRGIVDVGGVDAVFSLLSDHNVKVDTSTWNRRYREYMNKIKTGSIIEIADVLRSLLLLRNTKSLSFGEKKMVEQCKELLALEISLAKGQEVKRVNERLEEFFQS